MCWKANWSISVLCGRCSEFPSGNASQGTGILHTKCLHVSNFSLSPTGWWCQSGSAVHERVRLLVSHCKPHAPVATCMVGRWLKELMCQAGIDMAVFKGHSARGAPTFKAKALGLPTQQILTRANWKVAATFYKIYFHSDCTTDEFQSWVSQLKTLQYHIYLNLQNEIHNFINARRAWNEIVILWASQIDVLFPPQPTLVGHCMSL